MASPRWIGLDRCCVSAYTVECSPCVVIFSLPACHVRSQLAGRLNSPREHFPSWISIDDPGRFHPPNLSRLVTPFMFCSTTRPRLYTKSTSCLNGRKVRLEEARRLDVSLTLHSACPTLVTVTSSPFSLAISTLQFVWLSIWGADVVQLSVTFASFLIAISFMIGTAASNLVTAVLFIFVTRLYDVGDRVHIYNDGQTSTKPTDVTVVKVNLLTTVFKRWDEQVGGDRLGSLCRGSGRCSKRWLETRVIYHANCLLLRPISHFPPPVPSSLANVTHADYLGASLVAETLRRGC